jgi:2-keto-4-pentenoate hydratase/2-oxohepta-3-ene-1,7-dioic acid hydratase in catechol pathway
VIGPGDAIHHDAKLTQQLDWEVELAVIIGRTARRVSPEKALVHVLGYSVLIDISVRDNRRAGQWIISKGMDTYTPFGPCIVTADEIADPHNLRLWLRKHGEMKQDSNTQHMRHPVVSAAVCTTFQMLKRLGLATQAPGAGALLSGQY